MNENKERPKMLIADDENGRQQLREFFDAEYQIIETNGGDEFFQLMSDNKFEIALVDINLPRGREFVMRIKSDDHFAEIPVLALVSDVGVGARAMENGAADFLLRPYNELISVHRARNVLDKFEATRQLARTKFAQNASDSQQAEIDYLTGLYNREAFYKRAAALMQSNIERKYC